MIMRRHSRGAGCRPLNADSRSRGSRPNIEGRILNTDPRFGPPTDTDAVTCSTLIPVFPVPAVTFGNTEADPNFSPSL